MILLVNISKGKLHCYEFVRPIEDILKNKKKGYFVKDYTDLMERDLKKSSKIIICGTSLFDNEFMSNISKLQQLEKISKPVLGICGGMQIIGVVFNGKLKRKTEIGFYKEKFKEDFLGLKDKQEVYHLHNFYADFKRLPYFKVFNKGKIAQAVKHKKKEIYGVLFHSEVRQKVLINNFCLLKE